MAQAPVLPSAALGSDWRLCAAGGDRDRAPVGGKRAPVPFPAGEGLGGGLEVIFVPEDVAFKGKKEKTKA